MSWITRKEPTSVTEELTANEVVNNNSSSLLRTIDAVRIWAKLKHRKARYEAIELVQNESAKPQADQDWQQVINKIQNLKF